MVTGPLRGEADDPWLAKGAVSKVENRFQVHEFFWKTCVGHWWRVVWEMLELAARRASPLEASL